MGAALAKGCGEGIFYKWLQINGGAGGELPEAAEKEKKAGFLVKYIDRSG